MEDSQDYVEVLYNKCYGGFSFSDQAMEEYCKEMHLDLDEDMRGRDIPRTDPVMIEIVKQLGNKANGIYASLEIAKIPKKYSNRYYIGEYDGYESVQIDYKGQKLDSIKAALGAHEGQDAQGLKEKIEAILAETDSDEEV